MPVDDRMSSGIQMGDLIANTTKRTFEDKMHNIPLAVKHLKKTCGQNLTWVAGWDERYLRELREASIDCATRPDVAFEHKWN